jgi:hypothetical protein
MRCPTDKTFKSGAGLERPTTVLIAPRAATDAEAAAAGALENNWLNIAQEERPTFTQCQDTGTSPHNERAPKSILPDIDKILAPGTSAADTSSRSSTKF